MFTISCSPGLADCSYKADKEGFGLSFTAYGAPEKKYIVKGNTFKDYELTSESGLLKGAKIEIDATTLDTSFSRDDGKGGEWAESLITVRDTNVVNSFFNKFENDPGKIVATISEISEDSLDLDVTMNGVTKTIPMSFKVEEGNLKADGKLEIKDFATAAFDALRAVCEIAFHQGKTWSEIDLEFYVPVEKSCS